MTDTKNKMSKTIDDLSKKLKSLRTNRANTDMIKHIQVSYYGSSVPLEQVASISIPEPSLFLLNIFDQGAVKEVEKSIMQSSLQLTPQTDGTTIRIILPELTEERRTELSKVLKQMGEEARISIRNIRRDAIDSEKKKEKNKEITEDEFKRFQENTQGTTNSFISQIDDMVKEKEKEIMTL